MTDSATKKSLTAFARRLRNDPQFMAYVLVAYQTQEGLDVEGLAQLLGIWPEMLTRLGLCRRPSADTLLFAEQVRAIADYTMTDEAQLANIIRQVDSLEKLTQRPASLAVSDTESQMVTSLTGLLAAARDRDESENKPSPGSSSDSDSQSQQND